MSKAHVFSFILFASLSAITLPLPLFAARVEKLPPLPKGALPNSEVVTNVVLGVDPERLDWLSFSLSLDASASNSLAIAVGAAAGDALMLEEADFEWGYDCGKWFYADTATGEVEEWPDVATGKVSRTLAISGRNFNPSWNRIKVIQRGSGDIEIDSSLTVENKKFSIRLGDAVT